MPKRNFEKILLEAVDEGLSSLGESCKLAIYFHLEENFKVKREEIPCKIELFEEAIGRIFGQGASFLEILIMQRLHQKIGGTPTLGDLDDFTLREYVASTRESLLRANRL